MDVLTAMFTHTAANRSVMSKGGVDLCVNVNGQSKVPPGFRFHPTEEELLHYYLRKKVGYEKIDLDVIQEVDLNRLEPWDIQEKCKIGSTPQNDWYFFSHKDKKYPTGTRTNRATAAGFWKATGRDKVIQSSLKRIGMRKTLVFYKGRAPQGQKSDWIMHEYRLDDIIVSTQDSTACSSLCECAHEEGWVICRLFKKKNYHKSVEIHPHTTLSASSADTRAQSQSPGKNCDVLEQLLMYMDTSSRSCKQEIDNFSTTIDGKDDMQQFMSPMINEMFFNHLPGLNSPDKGMITSPDVTRSSATFDQGSSVMNCNVSMCDDYDQCNNWTDVDKFVGFQLEGTKSFFSCDGADNLSGPSEMDMWSLARSSLDSQYHLFV